MLKSLELNGFKSFAKRSELEFGSLVTAIVGPNGSGKSNVVEAFRFVLGEQSIKSMRGKSGSDLIFKGSKTIAKLNRAKVSIVFDNKDKVFRLRESEDETTINLDFDTIEIAREVFSDGTNKYSINSTEVRLKDIHELLASVHIGSSGHHIISQGQADRLLSSNIKERRAMIEDALGLKVYQIKIKDAEKKIEKTEQNIKEVESLRREITPHLRYLRKQVEKVKQADELRHKLGGMYKEYLAIQNHILTQEYDKLIKDQGQVSEALSLIDTELSRFGKEERFNPNEQVLRDIKLQQETIVNLEVKKQELSRAITRLEVLVEMSEKKPKQETSQTLTIKKIDVDGFIRDMNVFLDQSFKTEKIETLHEILTRIQNSVRALEKHFGSPAHSENQDNFQDTQKQKQELEKLQTELHTLFDLIHKHQSEIASLQANIEQARTFFYESQRERFEVEKKRTSLASQQELIHERIQRVRSSRTSFEEEIREGVTLVGREILSYGEVRIIDLHGDPSKVEEMRREIERIKIKLEEAGASDGEEVLQEYEEVSSREEFLTKELGDLSSGLDSLKTLIIDLKQTLDAEFQNGIKKINIEFDQFFKLMFGGGNAGLSVVKKEKRRKIIQEEGEIVEGEESSEEEGVDIEVSLPHKKVRELTMLSGGERSLTSIALLFAMSQVNPPPFLVLDETDAALDEANSRRYGDMIERLSHFSQLIVVTHNRETMSRAKTLYGVTVGSDGASKLLSIKFGDAEQYAK